VISLYTEHVRSISMDHLKRIMDSGERFVLLDVRTKNDFDKEHIKGARSMPLDEIDPAAKKTLKPDDEIIVYCDSFICSASTSASKILAGMGFGKVRDYKGGLREWKGGGLPTESSF